MQNHKSHKPCRDFATNSCEYRSECRYKHIKLQKNEQICYTCGEKTQTIKDLMIHIKETHGSHSCTKFSRGQCDRGSRCWYKHEQISIGNGKQSTPNDRQEEEDYFQESPRRPRRPYSQVVGAGNSQPKQVHQVSGDSQQQKIVEETHSALTQMMTQFSKLMHQMSKTV